MSDQRQSDGWSAAEAGVRHACILLTSASPADLERSEAVLTAAIERIRAAKPPAIDSIRTLRGQIQRATVLLEAAANYRLEWIRCLQAMGDGYTPLGQPESVLLTGHVRVQG